MQVARKPPFTRILFRPEDTRNRVHVGPWVGEFGYEVCSWVPFIRYLRRKRPDVRLVVSGDVGHHVLYQGLVDEYWALPKADGVRLCEWRENSSDLGFARSPGPLLELLLSSVRCPEQVWPRFLREDEKLHAPIFRGTKSSELANEFIYSHLGAKNKPFVLVFPRFREGKRFRDRNYSGWSELVRGLELPCIASGCDGDEVLGGVPSTWLRVSPWDELALTIGLIDKASAVVAPNSGGALLALYLGAHERTVLLQCTTPVNTLGRTPWLREPPGADPACTAQAINQLVRDS